MTDDNEDQEFNDTRVTDSPEAIWLVYGDLDHDDTHDACCSDDEVTWCDAPQFPSDVRYVRGDLAERMLEQRASEIERLSDRVKLLEAWLEGDAYCPCCAGLRECEEGCTFAEDDRSASERMLEVRAVLYG